MLCVNKPTGCIYTKHLQLIATSPTYGFHIFQWYNLQNANATCKQNFTWNDLPAQCLDEHDSASCSAALAHLSSMCARGMESRNIRRTYLRKCSICSALLILWLLAVISSQLHKGRHFLLKIIILVKTVKRRYWYHVNIMGIGNRLPCNKKLDQSLSNLFHCAQLLYINQTGHTVSGQRTCWISSMKHRLDQERWSLVLSRF